MTLPDQLWLTHVPLAETPMIRYVHDPTRLHQAVMRMFPDDLGDHPRKQAGALYRVESAGEDLHLLVQSRFAPNLAAFPHAQTRSLLPLLRHLTPGTPVHYRIAANPMKSARPQTPPSAEGKRPRGKRKALYGAEAETWWRERAEAAGLRLAVTRSRRYDYGAGPNHNHAQRRPTQTEGRKPHRLLHHGIRFEGIAEVTDPPALISAIVDGIGRGRAHGLGLLSIIPSRSE